MGNKLFFLAIVFLHFLCFNILKAQTENEVIQIGGSRVFTTGKLIEYRTDRIETLNNDQWLEALKTVEQKKQEYLLNGWVDPSKSHPLFSLPIQSNLISPDEGYYTITSYFDHDTLYPDQLKDYNCGNLTYDLESGYNHAGTDFFLWPYPWLKMANNEVEAIASAPGMVLLKQGGNFDLQCEENTDPWNGICILHEDGSTSWYIHLKKNSLTGVGVGQQIEQGAYLGVVGSSGSSLAPHLHFEVLDADLKKTDPFFGTCNDSVTESWWSAQLPYKEPRINKISTHAHLPVFPQCPQTEIPNESGVFYPGDSLYLVAFLSNFSTGDDLKVAIRKPDQSVFAEWNWTNPFDFYTASWVFFLMILDEDDYGIWNYEVVFNGLTLIKSFELKNPQGIEHSNNSGQIKIFPNPSNDFISIEIPTCIGDLPVVKIVNSLGQEFQHGLPFRNSAISFKYDISGLPPGLYMITVDAGKYSICRKVVRN